MKEIVVNGVGYAILPLGAVKREVEEGRVTARRFDRPTLSRNLYLAYSAKRPPSNATTAIRELMRGVVQDNLERGGWSWRPATVS
jgi:LysR family nitrogen assimilation transcriptional regulator